MNERNRCLNHCARLMIAAFCAIVVIQSNDTLGADNVEILYPSDNDTIEVVQTQFTVGFYVKFSNGYEPAGLNFSGTSVGGGEPTQFDDGSNSTWTQINHQTYGTCHSVTVNVIPNDFVNCKFKAIGRKQTGMTTFIYDNDENTGITIDAQN